MDPTTASILRDEWTSPLASLGCTPEAAAPAFADIFAHYSSAERHYHTLDHIRAVLCALQTLTHDPGAPLCLAAWLHDVVYDSRAKDNEEQSAAYARHLLQPLGVYEAVLAETERLILLTKRHNPKPEDRNGSILVDADLAILGAPPREYNAYAEAIRREYAWVGEADYRAGRAAVLRAFLTRPRIYSTEEMLARAEQSARDNLQREIERLTQTESGQGEMSPRPD